MSAKPVEINYGMDSCNVAGCDRPISSRAPLQGLCTRHRERQNSGRPDWDAALRTFGLSIADKFERDVRRGPDCWEWGGMIAAGYAIIPPPGGGNHVRAHRWVYEREHGTIPDGMVIDHTCHNQSGCAGGDTCPHRRCTNPAHLRAVTHEVNSTSSPHFDNGLCLRGGHDITDPSSLYIDKQGRRRCKACRLESNRRAVARYAHTKEQAHPKP